MAVGTPVAGTKDERAAASSTSTPSYPALSAGDLLLGFGVSGAASTTTFQTTGTGFSADAQDSNTGDTLAPNCFVAHKIASGSETGTQSWPHGNVVTSMDIAGVPGVDQTTPFDPNVNGGNPTLIDISTASSSISIPSVTVTQNGSMLVYVISGNSTTSTATPPAGWTEIVDRTLASSRNWQVCYKAVNSGATGSATGTWSGSQRATGYLLVLQPAGGTSTDYPAAGEVDAASSSVGAVAAALATTALVAAISAVTGAPTAVDPISGTVAASSSTAGAVTLNTSVSGTCAAVSGATGTPVAVYPVSGVVTATSTTAGDAPATHPVTGSTAGLSAVVGLATAIHPISGSVAAVSGVSGSIGGSIASGTTAATSSTSGTVAAALAAAGLTAGTSGTAGTVGLRTAVTGQAAAVSGVSGAVLAHLQAAGVAGAVSGVSGSTLATYVVSGRADAVSDAQGSPTSSGGSTARDVTLVAALLPPRLTGTVIDPRTDGETQPPELTADLETAPLVGALLAPRLTGQLED